MALLQTISRALPRRSIQIRHPFRTFQATAARFQEEAASASAVPRQEYTFTHARSKELFDKMAELDKEEIHLINDLIIEKLGITITEADKSGHVGGAGDAVEEAPVEEKTAFDLKLTGFDAKSKIKVIKEIRAMTGLGLKEAKAMVDGAPKTVKKEIKMDEAEELKAKLEAVGAIVEIE
mmetsp:Transcript_11172/g.16311  ORF Transcript_11172/g.16311 Transcript_11172/m.16311 type:complete len:179 (+) Transcript_11172:119-655(+)